MRCLRKRWTLKRGADLSERKEMIGSYLAREIKEVSGDLCLVDNHPGGEEERDVVVASTLLDEEEEAVEDPTMVLPMKVSMRRWANGVLTKMTERSRCLHECRRRRKMAILNPEPQMYWEVKLKIWEKMRIGKLLRRLLWKKGRRKKRQGSRKTEEMVNRKIGETVSKEEGEVEWSRDAEDGLTMVGAEEE